MKGYKNISVDIEFEAEIFPPEAASSLLISTIKYLLFQRRQIPFVFSTLKYMSSKWSVNEDNTYESFHLDKQRRLALTTIAGIDELCEQINKESKMNAITGARVIFGATPFTPKEIYLISIPQVSKQHSIDNHRKSVDIIVHKVLMSLLTCEKLYQIFSANIGTTNMYLDLETSLSGASTSSESFQIKEEHDFSPPCSQIHINLIRKTPEQLMNNCCRDVIVFESIGNLNLGERKQELELLNEALEKNSKIWKEAKVFVKGFKDVFIKGRSIWED